MKLQFKHVTGLLVAALVAGVAILTGCENPPQPRKGPTTQRLATPPPKIPVTVVQSEPVQQVITMPASIISFETAPLMAKIDAYVDKIYVDIGDEVKEDDLLVQLEAPELTYEVERHGKLVVQGEAAIALAQAELGAARARLNEQQALLDLRMSEQQRIAQIIRSGALSEQKGHEAEFALKSATAAKVRYQNAVSVAEAEVNMAVARAGVAKADYDKAKVLAQYQQIRAPFDGVISERKVDPGAFVRPASGENAIPLVTVDQIDKLRAVIHVTMDQAVHLDAGDRIELVVDDVPGKNFPGTVSRTAGVFDERTRMMRVEVDLDNFPSDATGHRPLRAGAYGEVTIVTAEESLVVVPKAAIGQNATGPYVVVVGNDGECQQMAIEVGIDAGDFVGVLSGIKPGDRVVASRPGQIKDKQRLTENSIQELK